VIILLLLVLYILWRDYSKQALIKPSTGGSLGLLHSSPAPNRGRLVALGGTILSLYAITVVGLYFFWYRKSKLSAFHWFDDRKEWNQMDKAGHIFGGYFQTIWGYELLRWGGLSNRQSALIGAMLGISIQSSIEAMDGYSSKWGASYSDIGGNLLGAIIAASQYLIWEEQRLQLKYSYDPTGQPYDSQELAERTTELFGTGYFDKALKDYNHMTLWLSINPSKFGIEQSPKWMNVAVGYSAANLYGGFENKWMDKDGIKHDRSDLPRLRIANLSLDADLPQLSNGNKAELGILKLLNIFKVPFPRSQRSREATQVSNPNPNGWGREE